MTIDPTREEWLAARESIRTGTVGTGLSRSQVLSLTTTALGPCPPEPAPDRWQLGGLGSLAVGVAEPSTDVRIVFRNQPIAKLTPDEADAMACSLIEHAAYAREQGDDPWRSDEEAAALIDAIKEPEVCGHLFAGPVEMPGAPRCQRPKGHSMPCAPGDDE